jgi:hypothetical protein
MDSESIVDDLNDAVDDLSNESACVGKEIFEKYIPLSKKSKDIESCPFGNILLHDDNAINEAKQNSLELSGECNKSNQISLSMSANDVNVTTDNTTSDMQRQPIKFTIKLNNNILFEHKQNSSRKNQKKLVNFIEIKAFNTTTISEIHDEIIYNLDLESNDDGNSNLNDSNNTTQDQYAYTFENYWDTNKLLSYNLNIQENNIKMNDIIIMTKIEPKRSMRSLHKNSNVTGTDDNHINDNHHKEDKITITCTTRILNNRGELLSNIYNIYIKIYITL